MSAMKFVKFESKKHVFCYYDKVLVFRDLQK